MLCTAGGSAAQSEVAAVCRRTAGVMSTTLLHTGQHEHLHSMLGVQTYPGAK